MNRPERLAVALAVLPVALASAALWTGVSAARDGAFSAAQMAWVQEALLGRVPLWEAPLGAPLGDGTTRADWVLAQALATMPAQLLGAGVELAWAHAAALGVIGSAAVIAWLASRLGARGPTLAVAALGGAWGPAVVGHAQHANLAWHAPWVLSGALAAGPWPWLGGLVAGLAFHAGVYTGLHAAFAIGVVVLTRIATDRRVLFAVPGFLLGLVPAVPVYQRYAEAAEMYGYGVDPSENVRESLDLASFFAPLGGAPLHAELGFPAPPLADPALPGFALAVLGAIGLWLARRERAWWPVILGTLLAYFLALGPEPRWNGHPLGIPGPAALLDALTPTGLRSPARWVAVAHVGLALGAAGALSRLDGWRRWLASVLALALVFAETPGVPTRSPPAWPAALRAALDASPPGPFLDRAGKDDCGHARYAVAVETRRPLIGGNYARFSTALQTVNREIARWPSEATVRYLRGIGGAVVIEHPPLRGPLPTGIDCQVVAGHRVCVVPPTSSTESPLDR